MNARGRVTVHASMPHFSPDSVATLPRRRMSVRGERCMDWQLHKKSSAFARYAC
jgi:hypothetical protein